MERIEPGIYRHFKGNEYRVLFCATHSESGEQMVVYQDVNAAEKIWVRPASMWNDIVLRDGKEYTRFIRIGDI